MVLALLGVGVDFGSRDIYAFTVVVAGFWFMLCL